MMGDASFDPKYSAAVAAQDYAALGWLIFPIHTIDDDGRCTCGKHDCGNAGKHPLTARGFLDASRDPDRVKRWWTQWPGANIGIPTGPVSDVLVIDIDAAKGGWASADNLEAEGNLFPATRVVKTGGGGLHSYFRYPSGVTIRNSESKLALGVDVRGDGGYVIAPPSLHRSGNRYTWASLDGLDGDGNEFAPAPDWLLERLCDRPPTYQSPRVQRTPFATHEGPIPEGERNGTLASKAGTLRRSGFSEGEILAALMQMNVGRCRPPLPESEVARIAKSIGRYPPAQGAGVGLVELPGGVTVRGLRRRPS